MFDYIKPTSAGELIGMGKSRHVYEYIPDPNYVIKINVDPIIDYNYRERMTYEAFSKFGYDWILARCFLQNGMHLMVRADKPVTGVKYDVRMFTPKSKNWGIINNTPHRIDYTWDTIIEDRTYFSRFLKTDLEKHTAYLYKFLYADPVDTARLRVLICKESLDILYSNTKSVLCV